MTSLSEPQNLINLIGGLIILFFLGWQVVEKAFGNISWVKEKREKKEREKSQQREQEITDLVKDTIIPPVLEEIIAINDRQNVKLDNLLKSSNDTMRIELLRTYFKYRPYKKIPQWAKEAADHLHTDYKAQDGNTFVDDLWEQIVTWEVVPSEEDLHHINEEEEI